MHDTTPPSAGPSTASGRHVLALVVGTRPEAIKVAPVALAAAGSRLRPVIITTGQHTDAVDEALGGFGLSADVSIRLAADRGPRQSDLVAGILPMLEQSIAHVGASAVLVQGDTASALSGALAGTWHRAPVVHLEAGLRSFDRDNPFPEEAYRCAIGALADLHLAPTQAAVDNLLREGVARDRVLRIGNTVVDAGLHATRDLVPARRAGRRVLVTIHRRENWGGPLEQVLDAIHLIVAAVPDIEVVVPVHPNPAVGDAVRRSLEGVDRVTISDALGHAAFLEHLASATLVLTDSGGVQEEAPTFGVPALVLRETTERPEAVQAGIAELVGTSRDAVAKRAIELLTDERARARMAAKESPFGDGRSAARTIASVEWLLGLAARPSEWDPPVRSARDLLAAAP